ncbi:MAG TPA: hypothetical protein VHW72_17835 [Candidatus Angelobacter sp.]|jgi:hypothetical protein|nr:hypothetical protein [Candidatus Angelobacter sp.]
MKAKKVLAIALICAASSIAQTRSGVVARSAASDYAAHASQDNIQIGASLLTHKELKQVFATDVNQCCLVVEVAFYPPKDNFVKISLDDFMLREAGMEVGPRPSSAEVLAARLEIRPIPPDREHRVGVNSSSEIGYERETPVNNGNNNGSTQTNRGGIYQRQSVGVGIPVGGKPQAPAAAAESNRRAIEAELSEKALPEVSAWDPVAGYLYFSVPKKKKGGYELVYMAGDKKVVLPLK